MTAIIKDRRAQYTATAVSLGLALIVMMAFKTYLVPLVFAATGLYVAWNRNQTVTLRESRLLYTVFLLGAAFLAIPYIKDAFQYNYGSILIAVLALAALPWVPSVWARIEAKDQQQSGAKGGKGKRLLANFIVVLLLMMVMPSAEAASGLPCPYKEPPAGTPQTHDYIFPGPGEENCTQAQLHNKDPNMGSWKIPACTDQTRLKSIVTPEVKMSNPVIKATPDGGNGIKLDVKFEHSFTKKQCVAKFDVKPTCIQSVKNKKANCPVVIVDCLHTATYKCETGGPETCLALSCMQGVVMPMNYMVKVTLNKLGKEAVLYQEVFDAGTSVGTIIQPRCSANGACLYPATTTKSTTFSKSIAVDTENIPPASTPKYVIISTSVTYFTGELSTSPVKQCLAPPISVRWISDIAGCDGLPSVEKTYTASKATSVRFPALQEWVSPADCKKNPSWSDPKTGIKYGQMMACVKPGLLPSILGSKDVLALWLGKVTDDKIPGINPGKAIGGWNDKVSVAAVKAAKR